MTGSRTSGSLYPVAADIAFRIRPGVVARPARWAAQSVALTLTSHITN